MNLRTSLSLAAALCVGSASTVFAQNGQTYHSGSILLGTAPNTMLINPPAGGGASTFTFPSSSLTWPAANAAGALTNNGTGTLSWGSAGSFLPLAGGTMTGAIDMNSHLINNVSAPVANGDAANKAYVDAETTRATGAESTLTTNLNNEVTRATAAESTLTTNLNAEVTRAKAAESTLTTNLNSEVTRATAAESSKLPLAGGTMTGAIAMGGNNITNAGAITSGSLDATAGTIQTTGSVKAGTLNGAAAAALTQSAANAAVAITTYAGNVKLVAGSTSVTLTGSATLIDPNAVVIVVVKNTTPTPFTAYVSSTASGTTTVNLTSGSADANTTISYIIVNP
jgi:hypothetical protein